MFLSMNWIGDFVDFTGLDKLDLIHRFSLSTAEVENEIFFKGSDLSGVVVAEIKSVENHPDSKKLHLLKVDAGDAELTDVVCGAPNVRVGMKTAFAKVGAKLGELEISPRPLAGYTSYGMCCSEKEIGISDDNSGIMDITEDVANGTDIKDLYQIDDIIFEVDNKSLTNRPDLWGHYGIAREFAALAGRELKPLDTVDLSQYSNLPKVDMKIEDPLCQRYSCLQVENISTAVSPVNMRIRLFYCGMRAINFLADLTNYLMLEMGQPMHAFDSRKVEKIRIKRFDETFTFRTLDGVERNIDEDTLMICNDNTPVAIAGIMGGLDSEIVEDTTTLTLESATFNAVSIRKSTVRLSHRTDASMRYEKCLDPEMTVPAIARFVKLMTDVDSGVQVVSSLTDEYAFKYDEIKLDFDKAFVDKYTGIDIDNDTIVSTLNSLGFSVSLTDEHFSVVVPSWRATKDVTIKADIIEEITRIYGYDNFDIHTANAPLYPVRADVEKTDEDKINVFLFTSFTPMFGLIMMNIRLSVSRLRITLSLLMQQIRILKLSVNQSFLHSFVRLRQIQALILISACLKSAELLRVLMKITFAMSVKSWQLLCSAKQSLLKHFTLSFEICLLLFLMILSTAQCSLKKQMLFIPMSTHAISTSLFAMVQNLEKSELFIRLFQRKLIKRLQLFLLKLMLRHLQSLLTTASAMKNRQNIRVLRLTFLSSATNLHLLLIQSKQKTVRLLKLLML